VNWASQSPRPASDALRTTAASVALASLLDGPTQTGRLLGASAAAVYLKFDVGTPSIMALVPPTSVRLPLAMVLTGELPAVSDDGVIVAGDGSLRIDEHAWVPGRWFDPRPSNLVAVDPSRHAVAVRALREASAEEVGADPERAWSAIGSLVAGDARPACALLGAGPGLTPAGDDVISGALAACALFGHAAGLEAAREILALAPAATTSLSAALMSCAADGQVVPQAARFLEALCGTGDVVDATAQLRAVGATSGTALALGIVAALADDGGRRVWDGGIR
jgi:Protein of unknown function (DUF2877)